ncbi:MAG TPA: sensor histidine kinase KdpD [Bacteroidales bacterium]|nr:sensor histidine kinase KdpD [Bacteroidales bacterium]
MNDPDDNRPDPDEILASIKRDDERSRKGKLKIFFGMCAGVGKTFSMLESAQIDKTKGKDIIIGYIETHGRPDTQALLKGFEIIPRKKIEYKGTNLEDLDIESILARNPDIIIIDELAHTNAPGCRHLKRYQDILDILDSGIDVYTTLNVQHLESRADTVSQITGIIVRETLPDEVFEKADEVELVDITPDELLQRFADGKVYTPERSAEAIRNFFKKGNITALREMSLRLVADRVDKQVKTYMQANRIRGPWKSGMHLLVVIGPSPHSAKLLRWAKNLSYTMGATLLALYVESPKKLAQVQKEQLNKNIGLAKQLGADFITSSGEDIVKVILETARRENITHIVIGKPRNLNLVSYFVLGNLVSRLIKDSGNIDVYVVGSSQHDDSQYMKYFGIKGFTSGVSQYLLASFFTILTATVFYPFKEYIGYQVVSFAFLFTISTLALFVGIGPVLLAAALSAVIWDYFFIPPSFTLHVDKVEDVLMLLMYFIIAIVGGIMTSRVRRQERMTRERELRTNALYQLTRELSMTSGIQEVIKTSVKFIEKYSRFECAIILQSGNNVLEKDKNHQSKFGLNTSDLSIAEWAFQHSREAGRFTDTLPSSQFTFYPLTGNKLRLGVVVIRQDRYLRGDEEAFWNAYRTQISNALEREFLNDVARRASILDESDKLYKSIFNSISHEFRIPVATIMGASDTLLSGIEDREANSRLYNEINKASRRLNRLIENLLNMSRLESGRITIKPDWYDVNDLANKVIETLREELSAYNLEVNIQEDIPLVRIDFGLVEQVLHNLVLNATQYSKPDTTIRIKMYHDHDSLVLQVMDRGPGFPPAEISNVFNKFYRIEGSHPGGTGLGLSIVKGFVEAHNGTVTIENRKNGGSKITVKIPTEVLDVNKTLY